MARPFINALGKQIRDYTRNDIVTPLKQVITKSIADAAKQVSGQISSGSSVVAAGNTVGGISSGLLAGAATLAGLGVSEAINAYRRPARDQALAQAIARELYNPENANFYSDMHQNF